MAIALGILLILSVALNVILFRVIARAAKIFADVSAELNEMDFFEGSLEEPAQEDIEQEFLNSTIILSIEDRKVDGRIKTIDLSKWGESRIIGLTYFIKGMSEKTFVLPGCNVWLLKNGKWMWKQMDDEI